jgi:hypothetical protein
MPVKVSGLIETRKALKKFAPDLYEQMNKEIKTAMKVVVGDAKDLIQPTINGLYAWQDNGKEVTSRRKAKTALAPNLDAFPKYNPKVVRQGITYRTGVQKRNSAGFVGLYSLLNRSRAGAIIETAGRKNFNGDPKSQSNNPNAGAHFNRAIQSTYGGFSQIGQRREDRGRIIYKAVYNDQGKLQDAIFKAINKATHLFNTTTKTDRFTLAA